MLRICELNKSYPLADGSLHVLRGIDLCISSGESIALTGESGSGKSTLLHLIAGLDDPDSGDIVLNGSRISRLPESDRARIRRDYFGLVFQQFNLVPSLRVRDNLLFQARLAGRMDGTWQGELTERLGLADLLDRYPEQLSGGQQQRVAIGRALASKPALVLADEPTGNLDEARADEVVRLLRDLIASCGCSLLMVTHSLRLASVMDRRMHLASGELR